MSRGPDDLKREDLLITDRLYRRGARPADLESELGAYRELSSLMTFDAVKAIERFLELALELCPAAGSAGLSELVTGGDGTQHFEWTALSGAYAPYVGRTTPRDFSPCGLCLDNCHTILVDRPARLFTYFNEGGPPIVEGIVVPLFDTGKRPLGTLWVVSHDASLRFDATDARVMEQLAVQLVLAMKLRTKAQLMVRLEEFAQDKAMLVLEVRHRVKNMIQMTSSLLHLQEHGVESREARRALREAQSRLLVLASVDESLLQPGADARLVDIGALVTTLVDALRESSPHARMIEFTSDCEPLLLPVDKAVPLGLLVNEAVTNALKHAFEADQHGEIKVALRCFGPQVRLSIRDNGRGFSQARRDGSMGMRLMKSLARQLGASLEVDGSNGATIELEWTAEIESREAAGAELVR